jgi:hypothetical protein
MLLTDGRRSFRMRDEEEEPNTLQGSLFAPESPAPPTHPARPPGATPDPFASPSRDTEAPTPAHPTELAADAETLAPADYVATPDEVAEPRDAEALAPAGYVAAPRESDELVPAPDPGDGGVTAPHVHRPEPRRRAAALSGPTLDDVVTRVWEGMRAQMPIACPVCRTEIEASAGGRCGACGSALD